MEISSNEGKTYFGGITFPRPDKHLEIKKNKCLGNKQFTPSIVATPHGRNTYGITSAAGTRHGITSAAGTRHGGTCGNTFGNAEAIVRRILRVKGALGVLKQGYPRL